MFKRDNQTRRRFVSRWFVWCLQADKAEQASRDGSTLPDGHPEHALQPEPLALGNPPVAGNKTNMVQRQRHIRWKKAKRLLSVHRLTEGCVPKLRRASSTLGFEHGEEHNLTKDISPERHQATLRTPPENGSRKESSVNGDEPPSQLRPETGTVRGQKASRQISEQTLRASGGPKVLPAPYKAYRASSASTCEECNSICAFGCQFGDECTLKEQHSVRSKTASKSRSERQELTAAGLKGTTQESYGSTISSNGCCAANSDALHRSSIATGMHDELESLTPSESNTPSVDGCSEKECPPAVIESVQEALSAHVAEIDEIESTLSRDTALISNGGGSVTEGDTTQTSEPRDVDVETTCTGAMISDAGHSMSEDDSPHSSKPAAVGLRSKPLGAVNCELFERVEALSPSTQQTDTNIEAFPRAEGSEEVKVVVRQVLSDITKAVVANLQAVSVGGSQQSGVNDVGGVVRTALDCEWSMVKNSENLSCPRIGELAQAQSTCALDSDGESELSASTVASSGMEASTGLLQLLQSGSSKSGDVQYPASIRAYRLQRRVERFHRYFEEFLETDRMRREAADRKSQVVHRVRQLFEDGGRKIVV